MTKKEPNNSRRKFLKTTVALLGALGTMSCTEWELFFHQRFRALSQEEVEKLVKSWEKEYHRKLGKNISVEATEAIPGTKFGYALDLSLCIGCRRCVYACVQENNQSRDPQIQWIRVLEMDKEHGIDFHYANMHYDTEEVPRPGKFYLPVQCQQCDNPPCVKACPVAATWKEPDGIVVIDYDWCIGCRCCMAACPYGARHFNWGEPHYPDELHVLFDLPLPQPAGEDEEEEEQENFLQTLDGKTFSAALRRAFLRQGRVELPPKVRVEVRTKGLQWILHAEEKRYLIHYDKKGNSLRVSLVIHGLNEATHYLGNRPRPVGVVEKCTFCIQRVRKGLYPACLEACPVGARKFGNLLDPESEIRKILATKQVFVLKGELNTQPSFFYYFSRD